VKAGENKQRAIRADELKRLFSHLTQVAQQPAHAHELWLPLVALYTGARVNEICQLNPQTDIHEEHGIPFFDFTTETEGDRRIRKSIKNAISHRKVAIHSALLKAGFFDYVKAIKATGAKLLFPQWKPGRGKASDNAEQWFIELVRDLGYAMTLPAIGSWGCTRSALRSSIVH
jgi:integrase